MNVSSSSRSSKFVKIIIATFAATNLILSFDVLALTPEQNNFRGVVIAWQSIFLSDSLQSTCKEIDHEGEAGEYKLKLVALCALWIQSEITMKEKISGIRSGKINLNNARFELQPSKLNEQTILRIKKILSGKE